MPKKSADGWKRDEAGRTLEPLKGKKFHHDSPTVRHEAGGRMVVGVKTNEGTRGVVRAKARAHLEREEALAAEAQGREPRPIDDAMIERVLGAHTVAEIMNGGRLSGIARPTVLPADG